MKLNWMSLDYEINMPLLSYLSGSQLKKQNGFLNVILQTLIDWFPYGNAPEICIIDETYNDSSNIDWNRNVHPYAD